MSSEALTWAKKVDAGSPNRKLILLLLADYADEAGSCYPSQGRIARETHLSAKTVGRLLGDLETDGHLRREHRGRQGTRGGRTSDRIYLSIQTDNTDDKAPRGTDSNGHSGDSNRQAMSDEPPVEPPEETIASDKPTRAERDALWEALAVNMGWRPQTDVEKGLFGRGVRELLAASASPADVDERCREYSRRFGTHVSLTIPALLKHWTSLGVQPQRQQEELWPWQR